MKKKLVLLLAAALIILLSCGCSSESSGATDDDTTPAFSGVETPNPQADVQYHSVDAIIERGVLRVGMRPFSWSWYKMPVEWDENGLPTAYEENGEWYGWEADFMRAMATDMGVSAEFVQFDNIDEMLTALVSGEIDCVMSALLIDSYSSNGEYTTSIGYNWWGKSDFAVFVKSADGAAFDLSAAVFGTREQKAYTDSIAEMYPDAVIKTFSSADSYFGALENGEISAIVESQSNISEYLAAYDWLVLSNTSIPDVSPGKGIYMMKGNDSLKDFFDNEIEIYTAGTVEGLTGGQAACWNNTNCEQAKQWGVIS
jgi:ABC-type amino acid transport substrate-binding protein